MTFDKESTTLVFFHHGIGDVIMAIPFLRACDTALPADANLVVLVKSNLEKEILDLISWNHSLDIQLFDTRSNSLYKLFKLFISLRSLNPTNILAPHVTKSLRTAIFINLLGAKLTVGPAGVKYISFYHQVVDHSPSQHKVDYYLRYAEKAGLSFQPDRKIFIPISGASKKKVYNAIQPSTNDQKWIVFAPGSGLKEFHKRWPIIEFVKLGKLILEEFAKSLIILLGNNAERDLLDEIRNGLEYFPNRCRIYIPTTIEESLALLQLSSCIVTGCSGSAHLAAAADTHIIGLYGPTNPGYTGPYSNKFRLVRKELLCSPCYRPNFITGCDRPICMSLISTKEVLKAVKQSFEGKPYPPTPFIPTTQAKKPILYAVG